MTRGDPYDFENFVESHLAKKFGRLEVKPQVEGSRPDIIFHHWHIFHSVVDAKHKPVAGVTRNDVDKLHRDMRKHDYTKGVLYISSDTHVSENLIEYAHSLGIYFVQLGWNGHESDEF